MGVPHSDHFQNLIRWFHFCLNTSLMCKNGFVQWEWKFRPVCASIHEGKVKKGTRDKLFPGSITVDYINDAGNSGSSVSHLNLQSDSDSSVINNQTAALFCSLSCRQSQPLKKQDNYTHNEHCREEELKFKLSQVYCWMRERESNELPAWWN